MTKKDYESLAVFTGHCLALAREYSEEARTEMYEVFYTPLVKYLAQENSLFDQLKFSYAVATAEQEFLEKARADLK